MSEERVKFVLDEPDIPTHWVNLMADMRIPPTPRRRHCILAPSSRPARTT